MELIVSQSAHAACFALNLSSPAIPHIPLSHVHIKVFVFLIVVVSMTRKQDTNKRDWNYSCHRNQVRLNLHACNLSFHKVHDSTSARYIQKPDW